MKTECAAASHNLILESTGEVKLCCNSSMALDHQPGLAETAIVGQLATEIQTALANGIPHKNCDRCWTEQQHNGRSYRYSYNDMYPQYQLLPDPGIKTIHIQHENTCNLTCVYCGPQFSSKWVELRNLKQSFRHPIRFSDSMLKSLDMITLAGGEPALIKSNVELLDRLWEINPNCQIIINTNLTMVKSNPVFERLIKFENSTVIVSFEAVDKRYEYIRQGAKWQDFSANMKWISDHVQHVQFNMILFPLSIVSIVDAINFGLEFVEPADIFISSYYGTQLTWDKIDQSTLSQLKYNLIESVKQFDCSIQQQIDSLKEDIKSTQTGTDFPYLEQFDSLINCDHRTIFTELYN
jgi:organic radical activating enzyme